MRYDYLGKLQFPLHVDALQYRLAILTSACGFFASLYRKSTGFCVLR